MIPLGLCATTRHHPDAKECAALGIGAGDWLRLHCYSLAELDVALRVIPADISIMLSANNELQEVGWDWDGWESTMREISQRFAGRVKIVGAGNELDLWHLQPPIGDGDPRLTPAFAASLVARAAPILHDAGIRVAMSSVASGSWPTYLDEMSDRCWRSADYCDLHLYMKELNSIPSGSGWQTADAALREAARISGRPAIASEGGIKVDDAGGLDQQAQWATGLGSLPAELVCYFAWADSVGTPSEQGGQAFGARDHNGHVKPVWFALQKLFGGPANRPPTERHAEFILGFAKWAALEPALLGSPLANERNVAPGWQTQPTENGVLSWVENKGHSFVTREGRVFRWAEDWTASREVLR